MTPDAVKYQITLENEQRLRIRTWQPGDDDVDNHGGCVRLARWSDVAVSPTSRAIVLILRCRLRRWGVLIAAALVPIYLSVAYLLWNWTPTSDAMTVLAALGVAVAMWNAVKFVVAGTVIALSGN